MTKEKTKHFYQSQDGQCIFPDQIDLWIKPDWENMPEYFQRINSIEDDRSYIILAASVLELRIEKFLFVVFPNPKVLIDNRTSFYRKLELVKAFNFIPTHFIEIADLLRQIRNDFAHSYVIDSLSEADKIAKLPEKLLDMGKLWHKYKSEMIYWKEGKPLRFQYKDLWRVCIEGFKVYELNVKLFRKETENPNFIENLMKLASDLRIKREMGDKERVKNILLGRNK